MKRFDEKVKDIVEVRSSASMCDFLADPENTLAGYHFTDITSELMAKWLDRVAGVRKGTGAALALAGFRGVGKSHFLAALGAIVAKPELRSGISDQHVAASAERLSRRHGVVAHVRRGSAESLTAEVRVAVAEITSSRGDKSDGSMGELMALSAKSGDLPPVLIIDTAFGRESRVSRDDGLLLSDVAAAAKELGIFVGLALDDDIAGADGINSSIAGSFEIDYLDQEHLYKIVNAHVFTKNDHRRPILHDIYESYKQSIPAFRWSENRFSSLYPLHPVILEIAPFIRLYLHDFALLGFASNAGVKILGRPANSLIGLDEVFDNVEDKLRNVADLKETFEIYDSLDRNVVAKTPVMQRHAAKLVLKGLFLLSLMGEGVSSADLAASMLIFDENGGSSSVESVLRAFSAALPGNVKVAGTTDAKFLLKAENERDINAALESLVPSVSDEVIWPILRRQTAEKFADLPPSEHDPAVLTKCNVIWRGSIRRGEIVWSGDVPAADADVDWQVLVASGENAQSIERRSCEWRLGELTSDDCETLKRFHILQTDTSIRDNFRDSIPTALHVHLIAVEKIWQRIFLTDGYLIASGVEYRFSEEAHGSHTLSQLFTIALDGWFTAQFPSHPEFAEVLGEREAARLIEQLFSGAASDGQELQKLAADFAQPLGLVVESSGGLAVAGIEELVKLPVIRQMLAATDNAGELLPIERLSSNMQGVPFGLTREARHLILAALVAQKKFEFVTATGNRINQRSLDLQIVWDDIIGLAPPAEEVYSDDRLLKWATALTGVEVPSSITNEAARQNVVDSLLEWLAAWRVWAVMEQFDALPDEKLNTRVWRLATTVRKTFGSVAESIAGLENDASLLDKTLQSIADAFWDSEEEFKAKLGDLGALKRFIASATELERINDYLLLCSATQDAGIDGSRAKLLADAFAASDDTRDMAMLSAQFESFKETYSAFYAEKHDEVMNIASNTADEFLASNSWSVFSDLTSTGWFGGHDMDHAMRIIRQLRSQKCEADVRDILMTKPTCTCSFSMPDGREARMLIDELRAVVEAGLGFFAERLLDRRDVLSKTAAGNAIIGALDSGGELVGLSALQIQQLRNEIRHFEIETVDRRRPNRRAHPALHPNDLRELENGHDTGSPVSI